jgi:catechol 2,3-dioxygenase-like lactoylglutathione lyase family enzyme
MVEKKYWLRPLFISFLLVSISLVICAYSFGAQEPKPATAETKPAASQYPEAHFHHLHLNTTDPKAAIDFYTSKFDCEKAKFAGLLDGVWSQKSWMLFTRVDKAPSADLNTAIWHFGWGAEDMKATYEKQVASGTKFFTPLTDISDIGNPNAKPGSFYYAYVESPDRALIELNTASHHRFGHIHMFSADPIAAGDWYEKYFGAKRLGRRPTSKEPRMYRGIQIGPSSSLLIDNVNIIIYPVEYPKQAYPEAWKGKTELESTKGHVVDHIGFSFANLDEALAMLRKDGVKVTDETRSVAGGKIKFAFIEGPDKIRIELVEGHPSKD